MGNRVVSYLKDNFVPHMPSKEVGAVEDAAFFAFEPEEGAVHKKSEDNASVHTRSTTSTDKSANHLHRSLRGRHVQLLGIGATIGSALFVAIGKALAKGGPLNLFLAFVIWSFPILFITLTTAEMVTLLPIPSPFVRLAGRCCDTALEVMTGWNFWFLCCAQIPFEITTLNSVIHFWRSDYSPAIPLAIQAVLYFVINVLGVAIYGETEFWMSIGKVILATGLILFTFITMVGGNPQHDAFGFRYWNNPGPMNTYLATGDLGRFEGFLACLIQACFTFAGPEYISIVASETINPRKTLPSAYKQVFIRLSVFFIGGALCVGILVPYNNKDLVATISSDLPGAGGSPYVIAMQNLKINVLPDIVNALLVTAAFSAGNSYTYCSSRTLYGLALEGLAPRILSATTKTGIPMYCVMISLCWALISFLQLGKQSSVVLNWIMNLITSCQLLNFAIMCFTYLFFFRAVKVQGLDRSKFPFKAWYQPWLAVIGLVSSFSMIFISTYTIFLPGQWAVLSFLFSYLMLFVDAAIFIGYKVLWRTKWKKLSEVDLVSGLAEVEQHEEQFYLELAKTRKSSDGKYHRKWHERFFTVIFGSEIK